MRIALLLLASSSLLRVCGSTPSTTGAPPRPPTTTALPGARLMIPEHNGQITVSGGLTTEVVANPDGRLFAYIQDAQGAPVVANRVEVTIQRPDGQTQTVPVEYDPTAHAYVGRPVGVPEGSYPVQVIVQSSPTALPVQMVTPPVRVVSRVQPPAPRFGGRVEVVGDHAVELVTSRDGQVAMFWMGLDGTLLPATDVQVPAIELTVDGRRQTVPVRVEGNHQIARASSFGENANVAIAVPTGTIEGRTFHPVTFARPVVTATMPAAVYAPPPPPVATVVVPGGPPVATVVAPQANGRMAFAPPPPSTVVVVEGAAPPPPPTVVVERPQAVAVVVERPAPPVVVVERPAPPVVVVERPAPPSVVVVGGRGRGHGRWRNGGVVYVEQPRPPSVIVVGGGGGGWHGGGGHWGHGGGGHWGHGGGRGRGH